MKRLLIFLVLCFIVLSGCTSGVGVAAGPFVTDIGYDGEGSLVITKNSIVFDPWWGTLSNSDNPQTIVIKSPKR